MRKFILFFICFSFPTVWGQEDTLTFSNEIEAGNYIFEQLDPQFYDYALLNKSISTLPILYEQISGNYNQIMTTDDWLLLYSNLALSCTDTSLMPTIAAMAQEIYDFYFFHDYNYSELIQPFGLILENISIIDTIHFSNGNLTMVDGQITANVAENTLYTKTLIKSATLMEFYPDNGYATGKIKYDPSFITTSADINLQFVKLDIGDGNGFQDFGPSNSTIDYDRSRDSTIAMALVVYELNDSVYSDTISFYLTTNSNMSNNRSFDDSWDYSFEMDALPGNDLKYDIGIKYGCGNDGKIRRPIIIACAYRPAIQPFTLNKYWAQFNVGGLFDSFVALGYDVIFVKDKPGYRSLEEAGSEFAEFIKFINITKKGNYPDEDWETVVMGYSMGGQKARYALLKLEKEHMENGGPHHHTKLYIPYDSPHHSANLPLFTQATYRTFHLTNVMAAISHLSMVDAASKDMGYYSIYSGIELIPPNDYTHNIIPQSEPEEVNYQSELNNNFHHQFSHLTDTRKTFPSFPRNIGISMGSYKDDYEDKWNLTPGMELFTQNTAGIFNLYYLGIAYGVANRKLWSSKYSATDPQPSFSRKDVGVFLTLPFYLREVYNFRNHVEWDMAQGGYKTLFYDGTAGGAITILKLSTFGVGTKHYNNEILFMPLVSALAINPTHWQNNNLYYNLQLNGMFIIGKDILGDDIVTDRYGYPHLGHPLDHFTITPFEAVYADVFNWDHIVMKNTLDDYLNDDQTYYNNLRDFLNDEVEGWVVPLQNKVIGQNHVQGTTYEYKAWYKSRYQIVIGNLVTTRTDPGDYIIESSGNITVYAGEEIIIKNGFHAKAGSTFHAYIEEASDCYIAPGRAPQTTTENTFDTDKIEQYPDKVDSIESLQIKLIPNPNSGAFVFQVNTTNPLGQLYVYGVDGKLYHEQSINQNQTPLDLTLNKGMYLVVFLTADKREILKLMIH